MGIRKAAKRKPGKRKAANRKKIKTPSRSGGRKPLKRKSPQNPLRRKNTDYGVIPVVDEDEDNES